MRSKVRAPQQLPRCSDLDAQPTLLSCAGQGGRVHVLDGVRGGLRADVCQRAPVQPEAQPRAQDGLHDAAPRPQAAAGDAGCRRQGHPGPEPQGRRQGASCSPCEWGPPPALCASAQRPCSGCGSSRGSSSSRSSSSSGSQPQGAPQAQAAAQGAAEGGHALPAQAAGAAQGPAAQEVAPGRQPSLRWGLCCCSLCRA